MARSAFGVTKIGLLVLAQPDERTLQRVGPLAQVPRLHVRLDHAGRELALGRLRHLQLQARADLGRFATAEEAALAVARFLGPQGVAAAPGRKRPAADGAGPSAPPSKRAKQPADDDDEEYVVKAEAVSDDEDDGPPTPTPAPPVLCYCERPAALLDGRWVCAQLVEGDFCILGREDE